MLPLEMVFPVLTLPQILLEHNKKFISTVILQADEPKLFPVADSQFGCRLLQNGMVRGEYHLV